VAIMAAAVITTTVITTTAVTTMADNTMDMEDHSIATAATQTGRKSNRRRKTQCLAQQTGCVHRRWLPAQIRQK
jgi:hypothetical protein